MAMVEPFMSPARRRQGAQRPERRRPSSGRSAIAAGLGATSAYTWLKLPVVDEDMERVLAATTLPDAAARRRPVPDDPEETYAAWERRCALPGVRGLVVGRALLYPPDGDVAAAVDAGGEPAVTTSRAATCTGRLRRRRDRTRVEITRRRRAGDYAAPAGPRACSRGGPPARHRRRRGGGPAAGRVVHGGLRRRAVRARRPAGSCSRGQRLRVRAAGRVRRRSARVEGGGRFALARRAVHAAADRALPAGARTSRSRCAGPARAPARSTTSATADAFEADRLIASRC